MTSMKTFLLGAVMTGALFAPAMVRAEDTAVDKVAEQAVKAEDTIKKEMKKAEGKIVERGEKAFAESDKDNNGTINEEEFLARHREKFKEIDANKDGNISKEEFAAYGESMKSKFKDRREHMQKKMDDKPAEHPAE